MTMERDLAMASGPNPFARSAVKWLGWAVFAAVLYKSWIGAEIKPWDLVTYSGNMVKFAADFWPPDFSDWRLYLEEMTVTVEIAVWGTLLSVLLAVPFGLLCAENIAPWWINQPMRRLMDACRAINEVVFAMLFVVAVGLGPFAGVLGLFVHTTGILAKLFAEAVEAIDPRPVEGIRSTGAGVIEEMWYGVIPQVMPLWVSFSLYRFESNVRSATIVGLVGAGGIGQILWEKIRGAGYGEASAMMLIILLAVIIIDSGSQRLRKLFL